MKGLLDGINPDGLSGWNTIASYALGSALVLLIVAVGVGVVVAVWGRNHWQAGTAQKGWGITALAGIGAMILGSASAGIAWGAEQGTASLMPEGARPQAVTVEKEAPKHTCNRQAVRDFEEEDPMPNRSEREALVKRLAGDDVRIDGYEMGKDENVATDSIVAVKWTAASGPDCSAENETVAECTDVEVTVNAQVVDIYTDSTTKIRVGENCEKS